MGNSQQQKVTPYDPTEDEVYTNRIDKNKMEIIRLKNNLPKLSKKKVAKKLSSLSIKKKINSQYRKKCKSRTKY